MLDVRYSHLYFYQSLNRLQRGLSAIAELLVFSVRKFETFFCKVYPMRRMHFVNGCVGRHNQVTQISLNDRVTEFVIHFGNIVCFPIFLFIVFVNPPL